MAGKEGSTAEQIGALRPCTGKSVAVTGEDGLQKRRTTKRKPARSRNAAAVDLSAAGESEAFGMLPAQERASAIGNTLNRPSPLRKPSAAGGSHKLRDRHAVEPLGVDLSSEDVDLRKSAKAALVRFPEAEALNPEELEAAIERIVKQSKPETASVAAPGMVRLSDDDIRIFLFLQKMPTVDDLLGVRAGGVFPPGWIETRRKQLEEQVQPANKKIGHDLGVLVAKIRVDLITKGYVEVQKEYLESSPDFDPYIDEGRERQDFSHLEFAGSDEEGEVVLIP